VNHHHDHSYAHGGRPEATGHYHDHAGLGGHFHVDPNGRVTARLVGAFVVIAVFMLIEIVGGLISGSLALLADATHMFADAAALGLAIAAQYLARRPPDSKRPFGYQRAQVLAAFFNGATLIVLMFWIVAEAVSRFINPRPIGADLMVAISVAGFIANAVAFGMLQSAGKSNVNVRGALLHVMGDLASSIAAIIAAVLIKLTGNVVFDPILSILVAVLIGVSAGRLLYETGHILLQGAPRNIDITELSKGVKASTPGVEDVHDVRIWQLTPDAASLTLHARINNEADAKLALERIKSFIERTYGIRQSTVQIELADCPDCDDVANAPAANHQHGHDDANPHPARLHAAQ
jgi:cobalt-zinc-cadmium efflux system protein